MKVEFSGDSIIRSCPNSWSSRMSPGMETCGMHVPAGICKACGITLKANTIDGFTEVFNAHYGRNGEE